MPTSLIPRLIACTVLALSPASAAAAQTNEFLQVQRGELPVIITAPHGGSLPIPGVPKRLGPEGERTSGKFVTSQDTRTFELATTTAKRVEELTGKKPYLVASKAHRQYVDPNRPEKEAVEHPNAQAVHAAFHGQVREFVDELRKKFPAGALLLDIHGQAASTNTIYRGTQNGTTVMKMVEKHGASALTGENSILGYLAVKGIKIEPPNTPPGTPPETRAFGGGYIVRSYGSHTTNGVDAIQLEFGGAFRMDAKKREETARWLAEAIKACTEKYLTPKP
ncbi:MAG: N-formylglutamate amidohydrolase [Verrucomicrobia bacterium]|nr:N-formylglutamate amidohydrolase [Verrucomicrobiota bacterium]